MIPRILHRTIPAEVDEEVVGWWSKAVDLHPSWQHLTYRDPLDPDEWPMTAHAWPRCGSGAQLAGLIRLEAVFRFGGIYIDSDLELWRPLDPLLGVEMFAGYEDGPVPGGRPGTIPDFVFGAIPGHPAVSTLLDLALERVDAGQGAWATGPGVFTEVLPDRRDVLLLPPGSFAPYHYTEKDRRSEDHRTAQPWSFGAHHWRGSWL